MRADALPSLEVLRHVLQVFRDRQVLRADRLTLLTADTVGRLAFLAGNNLIIREVDCPALMLQILTHVFVVHREILRDRNAHRAAFRTVGTAGAGDRDLAVDKLRRLNA